MSEMNTAPKTVVFRVDASLDIGTGHVMRCLTLAEVLRNNGADCHFLCRDHPGHLFDHIRSRDFAVHPLPRPVPEPDPVDQTDSGYARWLGTTQQQDAEDCAETLQRLSPDWLILDHYALDARWERLARPNIGRLMVIDDLADRSHLCDLLLDQTLGREADDYRELVPEGCRVLAGPNHALLRPDFAGHRTHSLERRVSPSVRHLLITMGGVDRDNATGRVLDALPGCDLPPDCRITVVMGPQAPWLAEVRALAAVLPWSTEVRVNVGDMGALMADADLAIGAAGSTAWERCCLGLPTLMVILADNQEPGARALREAGAALLVGRLPDIAGRLPAMIDQVMSAGRLRSLSEHSAAITDGLGAERVARTIQHLHPTGDEHA